MSNKPFFSVLLDWRGAGLPACSKNQEMLLGPSFNDSLNGHFSSKREPNEAFTTLSVLHSERGHDQKQRGQLHVVCPLGNKRGENEMADFTFQL